MQTSTAGSDPDPLKRSPETGSPEIFVSEGMIPPDEGSPPSTHSIAHAPHSVLPVTGFSAHVLHSAPHATHFVAHALHSGLHVTHSIAHALHFVIHSPEGMIHSDGSRHKLSPEARRAAANFPHSTAGIFLYDRDTLP